MASSVSEFTAASRRVGRIFLTTLLAFDRFWCRFDMAGYSVSHFSNSLQLVDGSIRFRPSPSHIITRFPMTV